MLIKAVDVILGKAVSRGDNRAILTIANYSRGAGSVLIRFRTKVRQLPRGVADILTGL